MSECRDSWTDSLSSKHWVTSRIAAHAPSFRFTTDPTSANSHGVGQVAWWRTPTASALRHQTSRQHSLFVLLSLVRIGAKSCLAAVPNLQVERGRGLSRRVDRSSGRLCFEFDCTVKITDIEMIARQRTASKVESRKMGNKESTRMSQPSLEERQVEEGLARATWWQQLYSPTGAGRRGRVHWQQLMTIAPKEWSPMCASHQQRTPSSTLLSSLVSKSRQL